MSDAGIGAGFGVVISVVLLGVLGGGLYGCPQYNVYTAKMSGQATMAEAESGRQSIVSKAKANRDASVLDAEREVIRAEGTAKANKIVAEGLGGPEGYLRYLYIDMLKEHPDKTIIYVPTEGGLPILEAGHR